MTQNSSEIIVKTVAKRNFHKGYLKNPLSASKCGLQYNFHAADTNSCLAEGPQALFMPAGKLSKCIVKSEVQKGVCCRKQK